MQLGFPQLEIIHNPEEANAQKRSPSIAIEINTNEKLLCLKKRPGHHTIIKGACCSCTGNICGEDFPNS